MSINLKKKTTVSTLVLALGLLILALLSYSLTTGKFGFFLDDWYITWTYRTFGVEKFAEFFKSDRPLFSYVYYVFIPLFKDSVIGWQLFAIFTKWLAALSLWALLNLLLPKKKGICYAIAALFLVFPGFKFHYFVVMYAQNYAIFAIYILSFIFTVLAVKYPKYRVLFIVLGMICQFIGIAPMELYYGLDLLRPLVIFIVLSQEPAKLKTTLRKTFLHWLPYLAVFVGFTWFRLAFSHLYSYQVGFFEQLFAAPLETLMDIVHRIMSGLQEASLSVWVELFGLFSSGENFKRLLIVLLLVLLGFAASYVLISKASKQEKDENNKHFAFWMMGIGIFAILVGMIPMIIGGFEIGLDFHWTRFMLPLSIGSALLVSGFSELMFFNKRAKIVLLALLIAFSIGANYTNGKTYEKVWEEQKHFFAQLTWRAPHIKPNTVLISTLLPFDLYFSGPSLTAPLNMTYAPDLRENPVPYQFVLVSSPQIETMPDLVPNQVINRTQRVFQFIGNTSDMLVVYAPEQACMKIISPETNPLIFKGDRYFSKWRAIIPLSNLALIDTEAKPAELPERFFDQVSTNDWCYYYQVASREEQNKDWEAVISVYQQAEALGYQPADNSEWLPLINAYLKTGNRKQALDLSETLSIDNRFTRYGLCALWENQHFLNAAREQERLEKQLFLWKCE